MNTITTGSRRASDGSRSGSVARAGAGVRRPLVGRLVGLGLVAAFALGTSVAAHAARFGVLVVDELGEPVAGASVCVGLQGNYRQFGTAFTDVDGRAALLEVPNVPFVVTVSKTRFAGLRRREPARGYDVVRELTLVEGLPGPRCRAGSSVAANPPVIDVRDVDVAGSGTVIMLTPRVTGEPSEYRIARDGDFSDSGATWRPFDTTIRLPGALADASSVVLQLRRYAGGPRASIEALSGVVTVDLTADDEAPSEG